MQPDEFYQSHKADWETLTHLLDRIQRNPRSLSHAEIQQLGHLYRDASSDLAVAQRDFSGHRVAQYLNSLVARAHAAVYRSEPLAFHRLWAAITAGYPRLYRECWVYIALAAALFILPAVASALAVARQPEAAQWLLPAQVHNLIPTIEQEELWTDIPVRERPYASTFIMQNNIQVAFLAFGSGILAGLPTGWVMLLNGLILGGLTGLTSHYGIGFDLWTFVIGHGMIELSVIFIAGGAGLMLGWAVIHPGLLSRQDALTGAAGRAVRLVGGCIPLLVIAGLIEGFISPAENILPAAKWAIGIGSGLLLYSYLLLSGRGSEGS
jgi:uncharacterized membrane protein SpoIIM required for sporulation